MRLLPGSRAVLAAAIACAACGAAPASGAPAATESAARAVAPVGPVAKAGGRVSLAYTARGGGRLTFALSLDRKLGRGDVKLGARRVRSGKGRLRLRIPRSARLGAYRVLACAGKGRCAVSKRRLAVAGVPRPVRVRPRAGAGAVAVDIGRGGGSLSAAGADGTSFTLSIPDGALLDPVRVTLTPVSSLGGLPLKGGRMLGAVQVEPMGTRLLKAATLTIRPKRRGSRALLTGFGFGAGGRQFHLVPRSGSRAQSTIKIYELKGYGLGQATAAQRYRLSRTRLPSAALHQLQQVAAVPRAPRRRARRSQASPSDDLSAMIYASWASLRALALSNLDAALMQYPAWEGLSGAHPIGLSLREDLKSVFRTAFELKLANARVQCTPGGDISVIAALLRYRTFAYVLARVGLADFQIRVNDLLLRCLRFEIDYGVTVDGANGYGEAVQASVKSRIPVSMQAPGATDSFFGTAPLEVTNYNTGPADCWTHTWNVTPSAPVTIRKMVLDVLLAPGAERAPATIEITFDLGALDEQVTHTCDGDSSTTYTDQQHAYDGVTAALLGGESGQAFTLRWTGGSGGSYASQTISRSGGGADGGNYNGTLSFSLRHTPGS